MAYTQHSPMPSSAVQPGQAFDVQAYAQQTQQYQQYRASPGPSPQPSPRPSPQPSPQPYVYQQVNRPPPSSQYHHQTFTFPPRSPQPPIQQSYRPPPSPQPIFPLPQGYTPPTHIPPSLQVRVKTPAPPEQTTASPRPHYAYLPQQNVITSVSIPSPPRATSPSRPLPPPRARPESMPPISRIQLPTSSFTENTLYRQPSAISASPTRSPITASPGPVPGPSVSPQPPVQALAHRPSYSVGSGSPPKPTSSFGPPVPQMPGQIPAHAFGQIPIHPPSQRSESPNRGRPLPTPTPRTPSPMKSKQTSVISRSVTDNSPQRQPRQPPPSMSRQATGTDQPSSNPHQNTVSGPIHQPTSSMSATSARSHTPSIKEIALPPATTSGQSFVPHWKRNLQGGPRAHGVQRRGTVSGGPTTDSAATETPRPNTGSFSISNPPTSSFPTNASSRSDINSVTRIAQKPTSSFDFETKDTPTPQSQRHPGSQPRVNGATVSEDLPPTLGSIPPQLPPRSLPPQTPSAFSLHQRRAAESARSNTDSDTEPRFNSSTKPQPSSRSDHDRFHSNASTNPTLTSASPSRAGFSNRSTVPPPSKPVRSQTYDSKPFTQREERPDVVANQHQTPPSPNKLSTGEKAVRTPARTPSPQYGILDMPRSRFSQRVEAKTEALNGTRSRGSSPVRSDSPTKGIPSVSPFSRNKSPTRNPSPTRSQGLPGPIVENSQSPTSAPSFPPALKRSSVTPQSVTLQIATMGLGEERNGGQSLDQRQTQRPASPPKPQQERIQKHGITKSESGWPSNLPRLPRTPVTSHHSNSTANSANRTPGVVSAFSSGNGVNSSPRLPTSVHPFERTPVQQHVNLSSQSNPRFSSREEEKRSIVGLDLDDAPPPSLRRSPSPASSVASSNFSSFSAAMENYRSGIPGSQVSVPPKGPHQKTGNVPLRQATEPAKTGYGPSHPETRSQPRAGTTRQQTVPIQPQVRSRQQPQPVPQRGNGFSSKPGSPVRQPPQQSPRKQSAPPISPSINVHIASASSQSRSPTVPMIRAPQAQSPQRQKITFPVDPDSDSEGDLNGPRIAVSTAGDNQAGPMISVSGSDDVPGISINVGDADDHRGNGPSISVNPVGPSVTVNCGKRNVAELPTIRRGSGLSCGGCGGMIVGRVVSAMGARWHPKCFRCCVCNELLENLSSYEKDGRSFCHLDYHEIYAPRCYHCHTAIVDERFITLDDPELSTRTYHEQHFFCAECGDPFLPPSSPVTGNRSFAGDGAFEDADVGFTVYKGHPYCENCHVRLRMPKCKKCKKSIRDGVRAVEALGGKWCWECFVCTGCERPFDDPTFFQRDKQPFCERCFSIMIRNEV